MPKMIPGHLPLEAAAVALRLTLPWINPGDSQFTTAANATAP
jgi:hypothetical protein